MSPLLICGILVIVLILIGMNIGVSFLTASIIYEFMTGGAITSFARTAFSTNNSYSLLAVPLFMLGGVLMEKSGIAHSLVRFCEALLRRVKGAMGAVVPVVSMVFGSMCGSGLATVTTIGTIMIDRMEKLGWDRRYTSALVAASGPLGYMIPPNMNAIIFALVSTASVSSLFLASIIPGVIWGAGYIVMNRIMYKKYYKAPDLDALAAAGADNAMLEAAAPIRLGKATVQAIPAFIMPLIILGGIYGGFCTPTEAGAVSALYALIAGVFIYRELRGRKIIAAFTETGTSLGTMMFIFPFVMVFSKIMLMAGLPNQLMNFVNGLQVSRVVLLLIIDLLFLLAGCFFDAPVLTLVLPPLLMPTMNMLGVSATQFGVIVFMAIGIGSFTPPMASNLFITAKVGRVNMVDMLKPLMPMLLCVSIPVMLLVTFWPGLSEWLPRLILGAV